MSKLIAFTKENGPIIVVATIIVIIAGVVPLSPKSLWKLETFTKTPQRQNLETTEGMKEVLMALEMDIEVPDDFTFRASAVERLRGDTFPVTWTLQFDGFEDATLPCFASDDQRCTFKVGSSNRDVLEVAASDCQASETGLLCSGVVTMKASKYLDISRSDAIVRPLN